MQNHAVVFLACAGQESGNVDQSHQRNIEGVAEAYKACTLTRCVAVEYACEVFGLVGHNTHALTVEACETYYDVLGIVGLNFKEFAIVDNGADNLVHVVGAVGRVGNDFVERVFQTVDGVGAGHQGSFLKVVLRYVAEEFADDLDGVFAVFGLEVAYTALAGVYFGAAESVLRHIFAGYSLHYLGTGKEHIADALGHDGEVGERGRVNGTAGAGTEDGRNLGNNTRSHNVALEDFGIAGQCVDAFLDTCAAGVVQTYYGGTHLHGHIHDFADFQGHGFG